jgi:hypothetical protein
LAITGHDAEGNPLARDATGKERGLPLAEAGRFSVYETVALPVAPGEAIRLTQNGWTADHAHRLNNGSVYTVREVTPSGDLRLDNGWVIGGGEAGLAYGYVTTSHSSQGRTVDRVFIAQDSLSGRASSAEQFYVSISRGREQARIYTDDTAALREGILRTTARASATELLRGEATVEGRPLSRAQRMQAYTARLSGHLRGLAREAGWAVRDFSDRLREARERALGDFTRRIGRDAPELGI